MTRNGEAMTPSASQRPWWKRKRWIAAAVLWLVVPTAYTWGYLNSMVPVVEGRFLPGGTVREEMSQVYRPQRMQSLEVIFAPANAVDRIIRPSYWKTRFRRLPTSPE